MTAKFSDLLSSLRYSLATVEDMIKPEHSEAAMMIRQARSILMDAGGLVEERENEIAEQAAQDKADSGQFGVGA